jgi:trk system potassium uptake protein TrkH
MNAWFESVSGYTTTGSTILTNIEALPPSLLFWRSSTHFIGGLGVIVFLLLILPESSPFKFRLTHLELSSLAKDGYKFKGRKTIIIILSVYIGLAIAETICLWLAGMSPFDAINHSLSTVATGGFSTKNLSIMHYGSTAIDIIIMIFMTLSAMHFGIIYAIFAQRSLKPLGNSVTKYYLGIIAVLSILIAGSLMLSGGYQSFSDALLDSSFQTVSFISTTGFGQSDTAAWPMMASALLMFAAIHCGCSGSTTGGIKADRMLIAGKSIATEFRKKTSPSSVFRVKLGNTYIQDDTLSTVFLFIVLYIIVIFVSFVALLVCGVEIGEAFSGTISSLGNVGPGTGSLGTMGNYTSQPEMAKFVYTLDMFLGRLEIFPILIVISLIFKKNQA